MSYRKRKKMEFRKKLNRRKKKLKLIKKGLDPEKFFRGGVYIGGENKE